MLRWLLALYLILVPMRGFAAPEHDPTLDSLHNLMVTFRGEKRPEQPVDMRCARPGMMAAKQALRDWIETKLVAFREGDDTVTLQAALNTDLANADLLPLPRPSDIDDRTAQEWNCSQLGYFTPLQIDYERAGLVVRTGIVIDECGEDDSAYVYAWQHDAWRRIWQFEEPIDPGQKYKPQFISAVHVSQPPDDSGHRRIMSLGQATWCTSNFSRVYYSVWQVNADGTHPVELVKESPEAIRVQYPAITGSLGDDDALIEFMSSSIDNMVWTYESIRHFRFTGTTYARVDPIALSPRGFVNEWLNTEDSASVSWIDPTYRDAIQSWHHRLKAPNDYVPGEFIDATKHCTGSPDLWQVGLTLGRDENTQLTAYFLVRWSPPYHFRLLDITDQPRPDCNEADAQADERRTLFPVQSWRWRDPE